MNKYAIFNSLLSTLETERVKCSCGSLLNTKQVDMYEHDGGIYVPNKDTKQWVFVRCGYCEYAWSWHKLVRRFACSK